jgi:hypothetical protein
MYASCVNFMYLLTKYVAFKFYFICHIKNIGISLTEFSDIVPEAQRLNWTAKCVCITLSLPRIRNHLDDITDSLSHLWGRLFAALAAPWLRWLVTSISPQRPRFKPWSVCVRFVVDRVALGQGFSPSSSIFPCQYYSIVAPYWYITGSWTIGPCSIYFLCQDFQ